MSLPNKTYGVFDLLCDIRDAHTICKGEPTAKAILTALASRASAAKGFTCFPSLERLAGDTQLTERTIRVHMKTLLEEGLVQRKRRYDNSYIYIVAVEKIKAAATEQRREWSLAKKADDLGAEEFDELLDKNKTLTSVVTEENADDASFPEPSSATSTAMDYVEVVKGWICASAELMEKIDVDTEYKLASCICSDNPGSAPAAALLQLGDAAIAKACAAKNPAGYLRSIINKQVEKQTGNQFPAITDAEIAHAIKGGGFSVDAKWLPGRIDALVSSVIDRGITLGTPYISNEKLVFPRVQTPEYVGARIDEDIF